jgi:hypothetical protein
MDQLIRDFTGTASPPDTRNGHYRAMHSPPCIPGYPVTGQEFEPGPSTVNSLPMVSGSIYQRGSFLPIRPFDQSYFDWPMHKEPAKSSVRYQVLCIS